MLLRLTTLLTLLLLAAPALAGEARVFVSLAGTLLEAEITAVAGDNVTLKRVGDGQPLTINKSTLCKEDNAYIARWVEKSSALGPFGGTTAAPVVAGSVTPPPAPGAFQPYSLQVQSLPSKSNRAPPSSSERIFETTYTFHISNREVARNLEGAKAVVVTLGKNAADAGGDLVLLQKTDFPLAVRAQGKTTLTTLPVQLVYSAEFRYGVRSHGYAIFILDAAGNMLHSESTPEGMTKYWKEISTLKDELPTMVDREFKPRPGIGDVSSYIRF